MLFFWGGGGMCWFLLPGALVFIDNFLYSWVNEHTVNTRGLQEQRTVIGSIHFCHQLIPRALGTLKGQVPCSRTCCRHHPTFAPAPAAQPGSRLTSIAMKYGPFPGAPHTHLQLWFIISLTISVLYFSALFGLWLLFGSLSYWTFIPFQETLFFFSSLSQLINNRESTSLEEAHPAS